MMKKQTAVELLIKSFEERIKNGNTHHCLYDLLAQLHQAKQMEREQIIEAHGDKQKTKSNPHSLVTYGYTYTGEMYYNETYSK
jgi:hypothetical protein